ncbi:hypothetical protein ACFRJ9_21775 [Paenarthrobacter sp. NPDC056912]|uniref:hypothetical protein n=1 Tax=Paenarthrobacter sp. NPDC056912 TaxID=3345965 RepID=UPI0036721FC5
MSWEAVRGVSTLVTADAEDRRARRRRLRLEAKALEQLAVDHEEAKTKTASSAWKNSTVPAAGRAEPWSGRSRRRLSIRHHTETSHSLGTANLFLGDTGTAGRGMLVGKSGGAAWSFDPWDLASQRVVSNSSVLVLGEQNHAKSALVQSLALRGQVFGYKSFIPSDSRGEWTPMVQALGGKVLRLEPGGRQRLNFLAAPHKPASVSAEDWFPRIRAERIKALGMVAGAMIGRLANSTEKTSLTSALDMEVSVTAEGEEPLIQGVVARLIDLKDPALKELIDGLRRVCPGGDLAGMFDGPSTDVPDAATPIMSIDLSAFLGDDATMEIVMACGLAWFSSWASDPDVGKHWTFWEEAWRPLRCLAIVEFMEKRLRLAKIYGEVNVIISHHLGDGDVAGDEGSKLRGLATKVFQLCGIRVLYKQKPDQHVRLAQDLKISQTVLNRIQNHPPGVGTWLIGGLQPRTVRHEYWTREEHRFFKKDAAMTG